MRPVCTTYFVVRLELDRQSLRRCASPPTAGWRLDGRWASPFKPPLESISARDVGSIGAIARSHVLPHRAAVRPEPTLGLLLAALIAATASAQPTVTVRAESRLELDVRRDADELVVSGALRDDLGVPLAGDDVSLELSRAVASAHERGRHVLTRVITAGTDGTFSTRFTIEPGDYVVDAAYEGAPEHVGTRATRFFDLDRAHVTLRLSLDGGTRIDLGDLEQELTIVASSESGGAELAMIVASESGGAELAHGVTDASGTLHVTLTSAQLGPPAAGRIIVRTHGDATRAEAQSELPVIRFRATHTTLTISRSVLGSGDSIEASGSLTDGVAPLEREAIGIVTGDRVLTTVLTDEHGEFHATLDDTAFRDLEEGPVALVARFDGSAPWIPGSESAARTLALQRPIALGWIWALVSIAIAALIVRWSLRAQTGTAIRPRRSDGAPGVALGARRTIVAQRFDISGLVRDTISGEPIAGASVSVGDVLLRTDVNGTFALSVQREATSLRVEHAEYLAVETALTLPHRGEHEGMQFRLASRRAVSFAALRQVAADLAPEGEVALALTQREIFEMLRTRGASPPALPDLVARVEVACYAVAPPDDGEISGIQQSAAAIGAHPSGRARVAGGAAGRR